VTSLPWYLLAVGIGLVVLGFLAANLGGPPNRRQRTIDYRMRDEDIARQLNHSEPGPLPTLLIVAGFACILVSVCWRLVLAFL
jgi:hypothetical protein